MATTRRVASKRAVRGVIAPQRGRFRPASSLFLAPGPFGRNADAIGEMKVLSLVQIKWYHFACLAVVCGVGLLARLHQISRFGLWQDEYWALYLATGRGDELFEIPHQVILNDPPAVGFAGAPGFGHIWTGLDSVDHPPVFYFVLRAWVDLFGESDVAIRMLPLMFGVAGILLLFDCVRLGAGPWWGLGAALMIAVAPAQIDFSQQVRPYTLVAVEGLLVADILLRGPGLSRGKMILLGAAVFLLALTHYFAMGIVAGAAVYVLLTFVGKERVRVLAVIIGAATLAMVCWAPMLLKNKDTGLGDQPAMDFAQRVMPLISVPQRMLLGENSSVGWAVFGLAALVYVVAAFDRRKRLWWLWVVATVCIVLVIDLHRRSNLLQFDRYAMIAAPAVFAILAMPVATGRLKRLGQVVPIVSILGVIVYGAARFQQGPDITLGSTYQLEDHREQCRFLTEHVHDGDLMVLSGLSSFSPFSYFIVLHYNGPWRTPVLLLWTPANAELRERIRGYKHVWMMGSDAEGDTKTLLPGYSVLDVHGSTYFDYVWEVDSK
jgi:Dolichyl-phosphate-mannose-protein mannosyltransferase